VVCRFASAYIPPLSPLREVRHGGIPLSRRAPGSPLGSFSSFGGGSFAARFLFSRADQKMSLQTR